MLVESEKIILSQLDLLVFWQLKQHQWVLLGFMEKQVFTILPQISTNIYIIFIRVNEETCKPDPNHPQRD